MNKTMVSYIKKMVLFAPLANSKNEIRNFMVFLIMNIQAMEQEVLHLPIEDRARLAEKLLSSLDALSEQEIEKLWLVEAQRRAAEIDNGTVQLVSAEEVECRIQAILK